MTDSHTIHKATIGPALYIVATPIGNLGDISPRALDILKHVNCIACEDTRVSKKLLNHYGISTPLLSYHEHNAAQMRPKLLDMLGSQSVALISDAGTPLISDPGYKLVSSAAQQGVKVIPVPGACSPITALAASGLPTDQFAFLGFLPTSQSQAAAMLMPWQAVDATFLCFTTASKCQKHIAAIMEVFGECDVVIARELTKMHEEFIRTEASQMLAKLESGHELRGEIVLAFKAKLVKKANDIEDAHITALLADMMQHMPLKAAVDMVIKHSGQPRNKIYPLALEIKNQT